MTCHALGIGHIGDVSCHGQLDTASKGFDKIANKARPASAEFVNDTDIGHQAAGYALPLDGMVKKTIAVVQRDIQWVSGLLLFTQKEVLAETVEVSRPEKFRILSLKSEDTIEGVFLKVWVWLESWVEDAQHQVLVANLGPNQAAGKLCGFLRWQPA